jgi:hypothetical protein
MRARTTLELKRQHSAHKSKTTTCPVCRMIDELDDALGALDELAEAAGNYVENSDPLENVPSSDFDVIDRELHASLRKANVLLAKRPS